jgi:hypothetical protein
MLKLASLPPAVVLAATLVAAGCQSGATASVATTTAMPTGTPTTALSGTFSVTGPMSSPRDGHTATLLPSGKVLIAGGRTGDGTGSLASAELYDPASGTFRPTGSMSSTRAWHTATLLTNGKVLIAGGNTGLVPGTPLASAELYDPATGRFSPTGSMATARTAQTETRLKDGRVLIAGGCSDENRPVSSAELYDPGSGSFSSTGSMSTERCYSTATLLLSGKVLLIGGDDYWYGTSAELYDPATGTFSATGSMAFGRLGQAATLLPGGKVLVSGGNGQMNQAMEVYNPSAGRFSPAPFIPPVSVERSGDCATLLRSGKVLIAGGGTDDLTGDNVSTADLYDPATSAFSSTGAMSTIRSGASATLLADGRVLVAGGAQLRSYGGLVSLASAELYTP